MLHQLLATLFLVCGTATSSLPSLSPTTNSEHMVVVMNNDLIFDIASDVAEPTEGSEVIIINQPDFGTISINADHSFTFTPLENVCEETDTFSYLVNHSGKMDTVEVKIDILCEPLTVLGGFTPDEDGVNDHFTILGIQNFPNNSLAIFNDKGEEIYYMKGYENNWDGTLENGSAAPEDTYYYVFFDGTNYHSGYLKISHKVG